MKIFVELLGWLGSAQVIIAYGLLSGKKIDSTNNYYQFLNSSGAVLLTINTLYNESYPSAFINVVWLLIAILGLIRNSKAARQ